MHSTVRIRDAKRDVPEVYTLVYPDEAAPQLGKLSVFSPVGTALLGTRAGDVVRVATADGLRRIRVETILYQPEAATRRGHAPSPAAPESGMWADGYADPIHPDEKQRAHAERLARTRGALRRARRRELMIVYALSALVLLTMLPAVLAIAGGWVIVMLWRGAKPWRRALRRQSAKSRFTLRRAWYAAGILARIGRAPFQARGRLLQGHTRAGGGRAVHAPIHISMNDRETDHEISRIVRQGRARGGYPASAAREANSSIPRRLASVRPAVAARTRRTRGRRGSRY
jgi:regulator of nucleoside diphosphate kinase